MHDTEAWGERAQKGLGREDGREKRGDVKQVGGKKQMCLSKKATG